MRKMDRVIDNT